MDRLSGGDKRNSASDGQNAKAHADKRIELHRNRSKSHQGREREKPCTGPSHHFRLDQPVLEQQVSNGPEENHHQKNLGEIPLKWIAVNQRQIFRVYR
jgi:hypothetical protein